MDISTREAKTDYNIFSKTILNYAFFALLLAQRELGSVR